MKTDNARVFGFDNPPKATSEMSRHLLGGKGYNLAVMRTDLNLPVPPGFTITTDTGLSYLRDGWPEGLDSEIRAGMSRIEQLVGRRFGGPGEPLLVSVRSGAPVSMPGMMETILNLGLNEATAAQLAEARGDPAFASGVKDRFVQMFEDVVGGEVPEDPWEQLRAAVEAVFRSWNSPRCRSYRDYEGISDDMCTAVTVQAMVFGNADDRSGTGVLFTRNPATGEPSLYGDVMFGAQGEDVVAGTHVPEPLGVLDERLPDVARQLRDCAATLERHYRDLCDIEFTIEQGKLWILQVRVGKRSPRAALRIALDMAQDEAFPLSRAEAVERVALHIADPPVIHREVGSQTDLLTEGLAASPGLASGRIVTAPERAVAMADEGHPVILVRRETSPKDVHGMARSAGILTSRGGLASHAAVVARGWGIPAVVGAHDVQISGIEVSIGTRRLREGDQITLDGETGRVFDGEVGATTRPVREAEILRRWADELGIVIPPPTPSTTDGVDDGLALPAGTADRDTVVRALHIKGFATADNLGPIVRTSPEDLAPILDALAGEGLARQVGEMFQLTERGRLEGAALIAADRTGWKLEEANQALDAFQPLDTRMKQIITAWQTHQIEGELVINDHSDDEYDRSVIAEFVELDTAVREWLEPLREGLPRLGTYLVRLRDAADRVARGDYDFLASPRLDSYHTIWFELHEDLIQLSGRTREEESEAGRA